MDLPRGFGFMEVFHAADERTPMDAIHFGAGAMVRVLERYGADGTL